MGWTCQYDNNGYCKLVQKTCVPGMKACILKQSEYTFSTGSFEEDKKRKEDKLQQIDFTELAKSH